MTQPFALDSRRDGAELHTGRGPGRLQALALALPPCKEKRRARFLTESGVLCLQERVHRNLWSRFF